MEAVAKTVKAPPVKRKGSRGKPPGQETDPETGRLLSTNPDHDPGEGKQADQWLDMQHVYTRPKSADRSPGQKGCRKWLETDPKGFLQAMERMGVERAKPVMEAGAEAPTAPAVLDEGSERVLELAEGMLGEFRESRREQ